MRCFKRQCEDGLGGWRRRGKSNIPTLGFMSVLTMSSILDVNYQELFLSFQYRQETTGRLKKILAWSRPGPRPYPWNMSKGRVPGSREMLPPKDKPRTALAWRTDERRYPSELLPSAHSSDRRQNQDTESLLAPAGFLLVILPEEQWLFWRLTPQMTFVMNCDKGKSYSIATRYNPCHATL